MSGWTMLGEIVRAALWAIFTKETVMTGMQISDFLRRCGAALVLAGLCASAGFYVGGGALEVHAQERIAPPSREAMQYSFSPIVKKAAPAVVNVYVSSRVKTFDSPFARDPFFRRFFRGVPGFGKPTERMQKSLGSGVLVSENGVIVTNAHVIKMRGKTTIRIALSDKREFDAKLVHADPKTDIAILKIDGGEGGFPFLQLADSDALEVGDLVLAIGNPFGVGQTVTSGIVSATARTQIKSDALFIQTDAAINPGNSGGALVDMSGRLVGINTAIYSRSGGSNGIGFAIPSNFVDLYVQSAITGEDVQRPWFGARLENVTRDIVDALGLSRVTGALVSEVYEKGPAADGGLKAGDVIVKVDGFEVTDARSVMYRLTTRGVGNVAGLTVVREGEEQRVEVLLAPRPEPGADDVRNLSGDHPFDGARVATINEVVAEEYDLRVREGVLVLSVAPGGLSSRIGFRAGDIILEVARSRVTSVLELEDVIAHARRSWQITIRRDGRRISFRVPG